MRMNEGPPHSEKRPRVLLQAHVSEIEDNTVRQIAKENGITNAKVYDMA